MESQCDSVFSAYNMFSEEKFRQFPIYNPNSTSTVTITAMYGGPYTNVAAFIVRFAWPEGIFYDDRVDSNDFIGSWLFNREELFLLPADDAGDNFGVGKSVACEEFEGFGYGEGTMYCVNQFLTYSAATLPVGDLYNESKRNDHVYSAIRDFYLVPKEEGKGDCPCTQEEEPFNKPFPFAF